MSSAPLIEAIKGRRTYYTLSGESPIPDSKIIEIVNQVVTHVPSSYNSQTTRVVVLLGTEHRKLWDDIVKPAVKAVAPAHVWEGTEKKLTGFQRAYGTILFYEDTEIITRLQQQLELYATKFPQYSEHTNAMHQFVLWTALEQEGFGANLQHYNPLIDEKIVRTWKIPVSWSLKAQLVFGSIAGKKTTKTFMPLEERVFIHGAKI